VCDLQPPGSAAITSSAACATSSASCLLHSWTHRGQTGNAVGRTKRCSNHLLSLPLSIEAAEHPDLHEQPPQPHYCSLTTAQWQRAPTKGLAKASTATRQATARRGKEERRHLEENDSQTYCSRWQRYRELVVIQRYRLACVVQAEASCRFAFLLTGCLERGGAVWDLLGVPHSSLRHKGKPAWPAGARHTAQQVSTLWSHLTPPGFQSTVASQRPPAGSSRAR
jgi:hypothetical protein